MSESALMTAGGIMTSLNEPNDSGGNRSNDGASRDGGGPHGSKPVLKSKTVWFNLLTLAGVALSAVADTSIVTDNPLLVGGIAVVSSLVNLGLRLVTKQPVK